MATFSVIKCRGLNTSDNELSAVPEGSMKEALNCIAPFANVLQPRRGQKFTDYGFGVAGDVSEEGVFWQDTLLVHYGTTLARDNGSSFTTYTGDYSPADVNLMRMKFCEAAKNLHFATDVGLYVLSALSDTPKLAGVPRPHTVKTVGVASAAGVHPSDSQAAYRVVWGEKDSNGNIKLSAPSQRAVETNGPLQVEIGGMTRVGTDVTVTFTGDQTNLGTEFELSPGEADFPANTYTIDSVGTGTLVYTDAGAAVSSTVAQELITGARNTLIEIGLPDDDVEDRFFRVYRSLYSEGRLLSADDDLFQCYEGKLYGPRVCTATNIDKVASSVATATVNSHPWKAGQFVTLSAGETNFPAGTYEILSTVGHTFTYDDGEVATASTVGAHTFTPVINQVVEDSQPEDLLGPPLYTNPNVGGDGIVAANYRPPIAKDVFEWANRVWYFNTIDLHRAYITMLGVGPATGVQNNDIVEVGGVEYVAKTTLTGADNEFEIFSDGSASQNVQRTASNLITAINRSPDNSIIYAFDASAEHEDNGKIMFEARDLSIGAFTVYVSRPGSWFPIMDTSGAILGGSRTGPVYLGPGGSAALEVSSADVRPNGLSFSKPGQPESVPLVNWLPVGAANRNGIRGVPLRDKVFLATEEGFWTLSNEYPFVVAPIDSTAKLICPDSMIVHSNRVFALTTQGVVSISDSGLQIVGKGIEADILELLGESREEVARYGFAVSSETDRTYILYLPSAAGDIACTQAFVYNSLSDTWTKWEGNRTWGKVRPSTDTLYMGDGDANKIRVERRNYNRSDYADESIPLVITDSDGLEVTVNSATGVETGDLLYQSESVKSLITDVDQASSLITCVSTENWANGVAEAQAAYSCRGKWNLAAPGGPSIVKQFRDFTLHFRRFLVNTFTAIFETDVTRQEGEVELAAPGFGLFGFGEEPFGQAQGLRNERQAVPKEYQRATQIRVGFEIREAWADWSIHGYSLEYEPISERNGR